MAVNKKAQKRKFAEQQQCEIEKGCFNMTEHKKTKIFKKKGGCNEDCFNCKYADCYKPTHLMKKGKQIYELSEE